MTDAVVRLSDAGFAYRPGAWVLRHLDGEVRRGEVLAILGPNGRGKTTLLKLLVGTLNPSEGTVGRRCRAAFTPQLFQVAFDYSVLQMVVMGRARRLGWLGQPGREDEAAARQALDRFAIADLADRPFGELSGGQRQLVILARALVAGAELLVMDEPMSALDLKNQELVLGWIARLSAQDNITVVFSTHQPAHAAAAAHRTMLLLPESSSPVLADTRSALTEENLRAAYGVELRRVATEVRGRVVQGFIHLFPEG